MSNTEVTMEVTLVQKTKKYATREDAIKARKESNIKYNSKPEVKARIALMTKIRKFRDMKIKLESGGYIRPSRYTSEQLQDMIQNLENEKNNAHKKIDI